MAVSFRAAAPQQSPNTLDSTPRRTGSAPRRLASRRAPPRVASRLGGLHPASCLRGESLGASHCRYTRSTKSKNKTSCWLRGPAVQYGTRSSLPIAATCTTAIDMSSTNTQCDGYISGRIDVQPDDAREVAGLQGNNITTSADDEVARPLKTRKRFGPDEDLLLIKEVNWILPYRQGRNKVMKAWQGIAERLNKLSTFNMCSVNSKSCQNRFNTLLTRHRMQEVESARASGVDEEYTEFRGLMDDIVSDFDEWESERQRTKEQHVRESDAKETAGAVVRDSAMLRLRGQRLADAKRASEAQGLQEVLREDILLRRQQHDEMLAVRKREREEEYQERREQREQEFKFRQAQMEAESQRISMMIAILSQHASAAQPKEGSDE
ncbi:hypothetical protein PF001_g29349 [Phytophthora fragariae]|uniref:Myb-like domain-containing protein n=3 Tax=Phytophthora fragariae TaxID=53985 RepID=A0A6A4BA79_9STRA|nr:hypothetical protein PF001_g29349 [Phytophthora fragariae]